MTYSSFSSMAVFSHRWWLKSCLVPVGLLMYVFLYVCIYTILSHLFPFLSFLGAFQMVFQNRTMLSLFTLFRFQGFNFLSKLLRIPSACDSREKVSRGHGSGWGWKHLKLGSANLWIVSSWLKFYGVRNTAATPQCLVSHGVVLDDPNSHHQIQALQQSKSPRTGNFTMCLVFWLITMCL